MHKWSSAESLNRTAKIALDNNEVSTIEEAEALFLNYRLAIELGPDVANSATLQAIVLTAVNAGRRCFLGGVYVSGCTNAPLQVPWRSCHTLEEAIIDLKGCITESIPPDIPRIIVGDVETKSIMSRFAVRATFDGWSGGIVPVDETRLPESKEFTPSGVLAGALAVSEAFQFIRESNVTAGQRQLGLSLWRPEKTALWRDPEIQGPEIDYLPAKLWLIGLGHLGQSFLWTLGFLAYARSADVSFILQDHDSLVDANDSTSPLTFAPLIGLKKTRSMAAWCDNRGFKSSIIERKFDENFAVSHDEPQIALCGVDNSYARSKLERVGFSQIIEAGLGRGPQDFLAFQIHTFPGPQKADNKWQPHLEEERVSKNLSAPYQELVNKGTDKCGVTMLAGRSVGAAFVGLCTSALVIAELIRLANGYHRYALIDGHLRTLANLEAVLNDRLQNNFNPGITNIINK